MNGSGIYQIRNETNEKLYVGQAVNLRNRWVWHRSRLRRGKHWNDHLQSAWNLYGEAVFAFSVLEDVSDRAFLREREQYYMDELHPEYNLAPVAGSQLGSVHSEETKARMSAAQRGRVFSDEHRRNLSEAQMGRVPSEETRQKLRGRCGENGNNVKLTEQGVREIRTLLAEDVLSQQQIADRYGVCQVTISDIKHGRTWAHLRAAD